ncbi:MAG: ABC transporter transmembrane domain-containing protein [Clostridiales bacterium]|nr:ABC transporter transmembrane domain-containing protein [Clostridiales bacterium]
MEKEKRMRVPVIIQMQSGENGATALAMMLAYHHKYLPMEQIRSKCLNTRNGSTPEHLCQAARAFGLDSEVKRVKRDEWAHVHLPCIAQWKRKYFVVVTSFSRGRVRLNDPFMGAVSLREEAFFQGCTGKVLELMPGPDFVPEGKPDSLWARIGSRMAEFRRSAAAIAGAHGMSALMSLTSLALVQVMLDRVAGDEAHRGYAAVLLLMSITLAVRILFSAYEALRITQISRSMAAHSGSKLYKKLLSLPMEFFEQNFAGELMERLDQNIYIGHSLLEKLLPRFCDSITTLLYLVLMFYDQPTLALVCLGIEALYLTLSLYMQRAQADAYRSLRTNTSAMKTSLLNGLNNIETIKSLGAERSFFTKWIRSQRAYRSSQEETQRLSAYQALLGGAYDTLMSAVLLFGGVLFIINGNFTMGMLSAFQAMFSKVRASLKTFMTTGQSLQMMRSDMERVDDILAHEGEKPIPAQGMMDKPNGALQVRGLSYRYHTGDALAVDNVSFRAEPGQMVAVVGATGCGKSTLLKMLAGLYNPSSGEILYDGRRRAEIPEVVFRASVSSVDQELTFFEDSLKENLKMWDRTIEDYEMILAARAPRSMKESCATAKPTTHRFWKAAGITPAASFSGWSSPEPWPRSPRFCSWMNSPLRWTH